MGEGLGGQHATLGRSEAPLVKGVLQVLVLCRGGEDGHAGMVLGGSPHHGRPADVDLLDAVVETGSRGNGLGERVQVAHDEVEGLHTEFGELVAVGVQSAIGKDSGMDARVERLDPSIQTFGESGDGAHLGDLETGVGEGLGRRPGRDDVHTCLVEHGGKLFDAGLVEDGHQGTTDGLTIHESSFRCEK